MRIILIKMKNIITRLIILVLTNITNTKPSVDSNEFVSSQPPSSQTSSSQTITISDIKKETS
jgi:hypothetical protein